MTEHRKPPKDPAGKNLDRPSGAHDEDDDLDAQLDDELEDSFPASDPPSVTRDALSSFRAPSATPGL